MYKRQGADVSGGLDKPKKSSFFKNPFSSKKKKAEGPSATLPAVDAAVPGASGSLTAPQVPSADVTPVDVSSSVPVVNLTTPEPLSGTSTLGLPPVGLPEGGTALDGTAAAPKLDAPKLDGSMPDHMPGEVPSPGVSVPQVEGGLPKVGADVSVPSVGGVSVPGVDASVPASGDASLPRTFLHLHRPV